MAIITPTCPNSKMENPLRPASCIIPSTTKFVEVPINVQIPPSIVAYERGIRNFAGGSFIRLAQFLMIGAKDDNHRRVVQKSRNESNDRQYTQIRIGYCRLLLR